MFIYPKPISRLNQYVRYPEIMNTWNGLSGNWINGPNSEYSSQAYVDISETDIQAQSVRQISGNHGYLDCSQKVLLQNILYIIHPGMEPLV